MLVDMAGASVAGEVVGWGRVIEHRKGWRAASAYPTSLPLICGMCFVLRACIAPARWVCSSSTNPAIAVCECHTRQYRELRPSMRTVARAREVEAELIERYGVERAMPPVMSG